MGKYKSQSGTIEAVQFTGNNALAVSAFAGKGFMRIPYTRNDYRIETPEGEIEVQKGDYVIKDARGDIRLCKPDTFEAAYKAVD